MKRIINWIPMHIYWVIIILSLYEFLQESCTFLYLCISLYMIFSVFSVHWQYIVFFKYTYKGITPKWYILLIRCIEEGFELQYYWYIICIMYSYLNFDIHHLICIIYRNQRNFCGIWPRSIYVHTVSSSMIKVFHFFLLTVSYVFSSDVEYKVI